MDRLHVRKRLSAVAVATGRSKLALVHSRFGMTLTVAIAGRRSRLECNAGMAITAASRIVLPGEFEATLLVVIKGDLPGDLVAAFAFVT